VARLDLAHALLGVCESRLGGDRRFARRSRPPIELGELARSRFEQLAHLCAPSSDLGDAVANRRQSFESRRDLAVAPHELICHREQRVAPDHGGSMQRVG